MNDGEKKRDEKIGLMTDLALLDLLTKEPRDEAISQVEVEAFQDMKQEMLAGRSAFLSKRQRAWVEEAAKRVVPIPASDVPRGKEVETPEVLKNLPKAPPKRTSEGKP